MNVSTKNKSKEDKEDKENCPVVPVIGLIEAESLISEIYQYSESINMSRVQRNSLLSYGR